MTTCDKQEILRVGGVPLWRRRGSTVFFYVAGMSVDADGAPRAYHPDDVSGLDALVHAGRPGNWWALVTDTGRSNGTPVRQGPDDPAPGFYVSMTALVDGTKDERDPRRYVDATVVPYFVLPTSVTSATRARPGDFGVVVNRVNGRQSFAIFGDSSGSQNRVGEGSVALADALGIPSDPRRGGAAGDVAYLVFPRSGNRKPRPLREIDSEGARLFEAWGGAAQLDACLR